MEDELHGTEDRIHKPEHDIHKMEHDISETKDVIHKTEDDIRIAKVDITKNGIRHRIQRETRNSWQKFSTRPTLYAENWTMKFEIVRTHLHGFHILWFYFA